MSAQAFFFASGQYVRYDVLNDAVDDGYPLSIGDFWPGMREAGFDSGLDVAADWGNGTAFFFKGSQYVRYNIVADKVDDGYPLAIGDQWPGMRDAGFDSGLDAAINWGNGKVFFFKGSQYVRYDAAADKVDDGYPLSIGDQWPGMRAAGFDSGVKAATYLTGAGQPTPRTADLTDEFFRLIRSACADLGIHPVRLLIVLNSESGVRASALHPDGVAAGINQFVNDTLVGLGWTRGCAAFAQLAANAQVPYVKKYFQRHVDMGLDSVGRVYQTNFLPATLQPDQDNDTVLAAHGGVNGQSYDQNKILDVNSDGKITIGDLEAAALRQRNQPRWQEIEGRL